MEQTVQIADLPALASEVLARIPESGAHAALITLAGDLGAGKTTFTQAIAHELGVTEAVQSPTYTLVREYDISWHGYTKLIHADLYRIESERDFSTIHFNDFLADPHTIAVVEWPERALGLLPRPNIEVVLHTTADPNTRLVAF